MFFAAFLRKQSNMRWKPKRVCDTMASPTRNNPTDLWKEGNHMITWRPVQRLMHRARPTEGERANDDYKSAILRILDMTEDKKTLKLMYELLHAAFLHG